MLATSAYAVEFQPYPKAKISKAQWSKYYNKVQSSFKVTERKIPRQNLVTYSDKGSSMLFAFTSPGHPAHPAMVIRQIVKRGGSISIMQIGYFAGNEKPFAKLFSQYRALNKAIERGLRGGAK